MKSLLCLLLLLNLLNVWAQEPKLVLPVMQTEAVDDVFLSPGEKFVVASALGGGGSVSEVKVWHTASRKLYYTLPLHHIGKGSQCFSPDGRQLITLNEIENKATVWNLQTGARIFDIASEGAPLINASFSHDGSFIMTASDNGFISLWDRGGRKIRTLSIGLSEPFPILLSPNDKLICGLQKGNVKILNLANHQADSFFMAPSNRSGSVYGNLARSLQFTADSRYLIAHFFDSTLAILDLAAGKALTTLPSKCSGVALSKESNQVAIVNKTEIKVFDLTKQAVTFTIPHDQWPETIDFCDKGSYLLVHKWDKTEQKFVAEVWDVMQQRLTDKFPGPYIKPKFITDKYISFKDYNNGRVSVGLSFLKEGRYLHQTAFFSSATNSVDIKHSKNPDLLFTHSFNDTTVRVWDLQKAMPVTSYANASRCMNNEYVVDVRPDSREEETGADTIVVKEAATGKRLGTILPKMSSENVFLSSEGSLLLIDEGTYGSKMKVYDASNGKLLATLPKTSANPVKSAAFFPGGKLVTADVLLPAIDVWDVKTSTFLFTAKGYSGEAFTTDDYIRSFTVSQSGKYLVVVTRQTGMVWDIARRALIRSWTEKTGFTKATFQADERSVIYALEDGSVGIYNVLEGRKSNSYPLFGSLVNYLAISSDGKRLVCADNTGLVKLLSVPAMEQRKAINIGPENSIVDYDFKTDKLITSSGAIVTVFSLAEQTKKFSLASIGKQGYFFSLANNYYASSPGSTEYLSWKIRDRLYPFNQWDLKYNRPDLVLKQVSAKRDSTLLALYAKAYRKRLKRYELNEEQAENSNKDVPQLFISNENELPWVTHKDSVMIQYKAVDSNAVIRTLFVSVNGNPLNGFKGALINTPAASVEATFGLRLLPGLNEIQLSCVNQKNAESLKESVYITYVPEVEQPAPTLHFVGIGLDRYKESGHNLAYSAKDIRDLDTTLRRKYGNRYKSYLMLDEQVSTSSVKAIKKHLLKTAIADKVIIAYSGHGLLSDSLDYFLSTFDVNFKNPQQNGLSVETLEDLLDSIPARQKLLLIDACHSGEVDKEEMKQYRTLIKEKSANGLKGVGIENMDSTAKIGMKNSFELMQELFVNVGRSTGATIISAAAGTQFAQERGELRNGVFTFAILELMQKQKTATVSELKQYVNRRVPELTNGLQQPTTRTETKQVDWTVW